ncbi:MAG TPA: hypothetical protein VG889_13765 [Rhizomicrobium sp.]|nr:hypothetical protein [Rhizomicrobium sp.]
MLSFARAFIEFGAAVRGLECADGVLQLLWRDWTNTCKGGAGWWEFGAEVLTRTRICTTNLKSDQIDWPHTNDLMFLHDYGIDIVLRRMDCEPVYGGWIMSTGVQLSGRIVHGHHALIAEGDGLEIAYAYDPSPGICVYRPENRAFNLVGMRKPRPQWHKRPPVAEKRRRTR